MCDAVDTLTLLGARMTTLAEAMRAMAFEMLAVAEDLADSRTASLLSLRGGELCAEGDQLSAWADALRAACAVGAAAHG